MTHHLYSGCKHAGKAYVAVVLQHFGHQTSPLCMKLLAAMAPIAVSSDRCTPPFHSRALSMKEWHSGVALCFAGCCVMEDRPKAYGPRIPCICGALSQHAAVLTAQQNSVASMHVQVAGGGKMHPKARVPSLPGGPCDVPQERALLVPAWWTHAHGRYAYTNEKQSHLEC